MIASPAPAPGPMTALPCQSDPDRWFDRTDRTHALAGCLACPARAWCARKALCEHAPEGMWAGIWIEKNLADVAHYLRAIAENTPPATPPSIAPPPATLQRIEAPRHPPVIRAPANLTVAAAIAARSSGHCEIMTGDCRLSVDAIASRIRDGSPGELPDAATGYAVCRECRAAVTRMEPRLSDQLGYTVDSPTRAPAVPFYWRQTHWLLLGGAGAQADESQHPSAS